MGAFSENESGLFIPDYGITPIIPISNTRGCIDPRVPLHHLNEEEFLRHRPHEDDGEIRNEGAAIGMVISLLGAVEDLATEAAVKLVYNYETSQDRAFEMHQDESHFHDPTKEGLGCAHFDLASDPENATYYGVKSSRVREIQNIVFDLAQRGEIVVEDPVLKGDHQESGLLIVKSEFHTVVPSVDRTVFFRLDQTRHEESLKGLATFAKIQGINVDADRLIRISRHQRRTTLGLVAEGKPIYEASHIDPTRARAAIPIGNIRPPRRPNYF